VNTPSRVLNPGRGKKKENKKESRYREWKITVEY